MTSPVKFAITDGWRTTPNWDLGNLEESNTDAMREVETRISMNIEYNKPVYLRDILEPFRASPLWLARRRSETAGSPVWPAKVNSASASKTTTSSENRRGSYLITAAAIANCVCIKFAVMMKGRCVKPRKPWLTSLSKCLTNGKSRRWLEHISSGYLKSGSKS